MTKRLPHDAYINTVEALVAYGIDVTIMQERLDGEVTDFVIVEAKRVTPNLWCMIERWWLDRQQPKAREIRRKLRSCSFVEQK